MLFLHGIDLHGVRPHIVRPHPLHRGGFAIAVTVVPAGVPPRKVRISFARAGEVPLVNVDGPTESKHRYSGGELCMWYPDDPPELRWARPDPPGELLGMIVLHLVREEWWRRTGEWVGDEAPHPTTRSDHRPTGSSRSAGAEKLVA
ncbi:hypothetical protein GCM10010210_38920 [Pseudonocardia hydrocarbonoxydans]